MHFLPLFMLSRNSEDKQAHKLCRRKKSIHPGAPTHTVPVLCERKAAAPFLYDSQSLRGIVTVVNQNRIFPNTFTKKILSLVRGHCQDLLRANKAGLLPLTHDIRRMYIWLFLRLSLSNGQYTRRC